jgi:hypothetical protein
VLTFSRDFLWNTTDVSSLEELLQEVAGGGIHALEMTDDLVGAGLTVSSEPTTSFVLYVNPASVEKQSHEWGL